MRTPASLLPSGVITNRLSEFKFGDTLSAMKATIEIEDSLYRQVQTEAALQGRNVKDLVADALRGMLQQSAEKSVAAPQAEWSTKPAWFGSLREYAKNAHGDHDLASMRASVARGRGAVDTE